MPDPAFIEVERAQGFPAVFLALAVAILVYWVWARLDRKREREALATLAETDAVHAVIDREPVDAITLGLAATRRPGIVLPLFDPNVRPKRAAGIRLR